MFQTFIDFHVTIMTEPTAVNTTNPYPLGKMDDTAPEPPEGRPFEKSPLLLPPQDFALGALKAFIFGLHDLGPPIMSKADFTSQFLSLKFTLEAILDVPYIEACASRYWNMSR